jgi:hypothetical protein
MISPAHHEFPQEASLIGLLVIGYSELDITLCHVGGLALGEKWAVLDALHKIQNEGTRLDVVNRLVRHVFKAKGYEAKFGEAIGAISFCKTIRNQYAHAQWKTGNGQLWFTNPRRIKWVANGPIEWKPTSLPVLEAQEAYFEYTRKCLMWLEHQWDGLGKHLRWPDHMKQPPLEALDRRG